MMRTLEIKYWIALTENTTDYVNETHLPFLMVFRPIRASKTGSIFSPIFSISTQSPFATARSMASRYL